MKKFISILLVISLIAINLHTILANEEKVFSDIDGHWAENSIKELNAYGLISGYKDGTFRPNDIVSRAEMIAWVTRVLKYKMTPERYKQLSSKRDVSKYYYGLPMSLANYFIDYKNLDIDNNYWCKKAIEEGYWLQILPYLGLTTPVRVYLSAEEYNKPATRGEFAYCITRAAEWFDDEFKAPFVALESYVKKYITDIDTSDEFPLRSARAFLQGFFSGYSDKTFRPKKLVTRAEATAVLLKLIDPERLNQFSINENYIKLDSLYYTPHYYDNYMRMEAGCTIDFYPPYYRSEDWVVDEVLEIANILNESASIINNYDKNGYQLFSYNNLNGFLTLKFYESYVRMNFGSQYHEHLKDTVLGSFTVDIKYLDYSLKRDNEDNLNGCIYSFKLNPNYTLLKKYHWNSVKQICMYLFESDANLLLERIDNFYLSSNKKFNTSYFNLNNRKVKLKECSDGVLIINIEVKK